MNKYLFVSISAVFLLVVGMFVLPLNSQTNTTIVPANKYIQVTYDSPFTVPNGQIVMITALGRLAPSPSIELINFAINDSPAGYNYFSANLPHAASVQAWVPGLTAESGDVISVLETNGVVYAKFLVD